MNIISFDRVRLFSSGLTLQRPHVRTVNVRCPINVFHGDCAVCNPICGHDVLKLSYRWCTKCVVKLSGSPCRLDLPRSVERCVLFNRINLHCRLRSTHSCKFTNAARHKIVQSLFIFDKLDILTADVSDSKASFFVIIINIVIVNHFVITEDICDSHRIIPHFTISWKGTHHMNFHDSAVGRQLDRRNLMDVCHQLWVAEYTYRRLIVKEDDIKQFKSAEVRSMYFITLIIIQLAAAKVIVILHIGPPSHTGCHCCSSGWSGSRLCIVVCLRCRRRRIH